MSICPWLPLLGYICDQEAEEDSAANFILLCRMPVYLKNRQIITHVLTRCYPTVYNCKCKCECFRFTFDIFKFLLVLLFLRTGVYLLEQVYTFRCIVFKYRYIPIKAVHKVIFIAKQINGFVSQKGSKSKRYQA